MLRAVPPRFLRSTLHGKLGYTNDKSVSGNYLWLSQLLSVRNVAARLSPPCGPFNAFPESFAEPWVKASKVRNGAFQRCDFLGGGAMVWSLQGKDFAINGFP